MKRIFSIIIPTYNRQDSITSTLDTVKGQHYRPIEIVLVDDGSTDNTKVVVSEWAKENVSEDLSFTYLYQANSGPAAARNLGLKKSTGQYIQYLDSDDYLHPARLMKIAKLFYEENADLAITGFEMFNDETGDVVSQEYGYPDENQLELVLKGQLVVQPLRCAFSRSLLNKIDPWNETMEMGEDRLYIERALCLSEKAVGLREVLGSLRRGSSDHRSKHYSQRCRVMCEASLAQYAYPRSDISLEAKKAHLSRVIRIGLRLGYNKDFELAKQCIEIVEKASLRLPMTIRLKLIACYFGSAGSGLFAGWLWLRHRFNRSASVTVR